MVLLIFLLLPLSLANQVCINITKDYDMTVTMSSDGIVIDKPLTDVKCTAYGIVESPLPCIFQCTPINMTAFNESYVCLNATVKTYKHKTDYYMQECNCTSLLCKAEHTLPMIVSVDYDSSLQREMLHLSYILNICQDHFNEEVKKAYVKAETHIIHNIIRTSRFEYGTSINYDLPAFSMNVEKITATNLSSSGSSSIQANIPQLPPSYDSYAVENWLPVDPLRSIPNEKRIVAFVSHKQQIPFIINQRDMSSMVYRIELLDRHRFFNLTVPISMTFRVAPHKHAANQVLACHYLDEDAWLWKTDGCTTRNKSQREIVCSCNHTTAFAVLLIRMNDIPEIHWQILSSISYVGCGLSAFFTALSIILYAFNQSAKMDHSIYIHLSLSGALFLLNATFLLTEWGATLELGWVCIFIAAFMHFSLLSSFTWMAIEALHLYLMIIKVFNTDYKHYRLKLLMFGWGLPGVIVAVSVAVKDVKQFYGVTYVSMAGTNQTNSICWITDDTFFYSVNLLYFILTFIFNSGILMAVASSICKMHRVAHRHTGLKSNGGGTAQTYSDKLSGSCKSGLTVLGLTCLMGTSWGLAFLGSGFVNYPILYLFCILNSSQGFFIFLWICLSIRKQRMQACKDRITLNTTQSSNTKPD